MGSHFREKTKIFAIGEALVGYSGNSDQCEEVLAWFKSGRDPATFPQSQRDKDYWAGLLVVWPDGMLWKYERTPYPIKFPPQQFAIGSGCDFALAAMYLGKTATEAVEVACVFDAGCGNGVDVLMHNDP